MNRGTQNAQMQGGQTGAPQGAEWPWIDLAEGDRDYDGLARL